MYTGAAARSISKKASQSAGGHHEFIVRRMRSLGAVILLAALLAGIHLAKKRMLEAKRAAPIVLAEAG